MDKKIKILVIPSDKTGCGFFRSIQPHLFLKENYKDLFDIDITYDLPNENLDKFFSQYDIVHIHKRLDVNCQLINLIKFVGCKVIIDVDDHWNLGNDHPMSSTSKREHWAEPIINHIKMADAVTTTTEIFKKEIIKYNKNVFILPNAIDPNDERFKVKQTSTNRVRFGIICGSSHLKDIELMNGMIKQIPKDVLDKIQIVLCGFDTRGTRKIYYKDTEETKTIPIKPEESVWYEYEKILTDNYNIVSKEHKDFLHKFIQNSEYPYINSEPYRRCWTKDMDNYYKHYENIDVLLVPLKENTFNSVKSQLKVVEAGFAHKAIIAQDFGPYTIDLNSMIEKGGNINENGNSLLVESSKNHKQWAKYIIKLANDRDMIKKLQDNLYNTVKDTYSLENVCKYRAKIYLELLK